MKPFWEKQTCENCWLKTIKEILGEDFSKFYSYYEDGSVRGNWNNSGKLYEEFRKIIGDKDQVYCLTVDYNDWGSVRLCLDCLLEAIENYPEPINVDKAVVQKWLDEH